MYIFNLHRCDTRAVRGSALLKETFGCSDSTREDAPRASEYVCD